MKKAIIIHGWEETSQGQWLPWLGEQLREKGYVVEIPQMPHTKNPKLNEWMEMLESFSPDKNTLLIGHSLANALILKYIAKANTRIKGAVMVAVWDWLFQDVKEFHETFFENGFDYEAIKKNNTPTVIVNSTTDPWIDFERAKKLANKIDATFIAIEKAGHFMVRDGYAQFPKLVEIIENKFT
ncbi:hypothetical protein COU88_05615 [Candidatus Roizmanbacteria bacterium CG10_big_fil_rev_8_21_14_0_10_39_6]|uniref:Alpha/beta hydrolase n=1 Tax=Candidatus Roizmanbacteria bacterium CG10_big_fil_rev_8_21_14_0_10_39_6 TaxID=1974853 RepID=A0A2M8KQX3_9BACT|nr:MAG: hypothetical protein COU88_05615 [Candidatus Roizmanbacteria bacterium CG10_big_fil_rev_8_21_14_0_10_39_6]